MRILLISSSPGARFRSWATEPWLTDHNRSRIRFLVGKSRTDSSPAPGSRTDSSPAPGSRTDSSPTPEFTTDSSSSSSPLNKRESKDFLSFYHVLNSYTVVGVYINTMKMTFLFKFWLSKSFFWQLLLTSMLMCIQYPCCLTA
jgi:hypothetical protein